MSFWPWYPRPPKNIWFKRHFGIPWNYQDGDVLFSGTGGLHHLVDGAVTAIEEALAEAEGEVVDDFRLLVRKQLLIVATCGEEAGRVFWSAGRNHRSHRTYRTYLFGSSLQVQLRAFFHELTAFLLHATLVAIEKGDRRITPRELVMLASVHGRPLSEWLSEKPAPVPLVPQFRMPPRELNLKQSEVREAASKLESLARDYAELEERLASLGSPAAQDFMGPEYQSESDL